MQKNYYNENNMDKIMIHTYEKLNDDDKTVTQDTRFIYRLCFRHLLIICHRPDYSVITKLRI